MELDPPHPLAGAHWARPEHQKDPGDVLRRSDLDALTPVFGNTVPPRGLSGRIRRRAYRIAEHRTSHWFLLLLADRVDRWEHRFIRAAPVAIPVVLAVGAMALATQS
jgi:hypothetical protein